MKTIKWGILGVNWIADKVVSGILANANTAVLAAASRTEERTRAFAARYGIQRVYKSCQELCNDPDIDIIYIATPNANHYEHADLCLSHGKHVLCEKPFTINEQQAQALFDKAREKGLFIMEAIWTRFLPIVPRVREMIAAGQIGDLVHVKSNCMFRSDLNDTQNRILNPNLAGGALLDLGVYTLHFIDLFLSKEPSSIQSAVKMGESGVDLHSHTLLCYDNGAMASFSAAIDSQTTETNYIYGTKGVIEIDSCIWMHNMTVRFYDNSPEITEHFAFGVNGYEYQAAAVLSAIAKGQLETEEAPAKKTLAVMHTMDRIREKWGFLYPGEKAERQR